MILKNDNETEDQKAEDAADETSKEEEAVTEASEVAEEFRDDEVAAYSEEESLPAQNAPAEEVAAEPDSELLPASEDAAVEIPDEDVEGDIGAEAAVEFEGDRPLVKELVYQTPKANQKEDQEESESLRFSSVAEAKSVVEGFLFSCNEPLTVAKLSKLMNNLHPKSVRGLLLELQWDYENRPGALQVVEIAGGYQMSTRAHVAPWMFRMHKHKRRSALSPATLETLAIVAYRQPITKGEVETIRGVESGAPLRTLQDLNLVEASGRREVIGRPQLYVTTEQFLKSFGLKSVADLPSISELKNRFAEEQKLKRVVAEEAKAKPAADPEEEEAQGEEAASDAGELPSNDAEVLSEADESAGADPDAVVADFEPADETSGDDTAVVPDDEVEAEAETESEKNGADETEQDEIQDELDDVDELEDDSPEERPGKQTQGSFEEEDSLDVT